MTVQSLAYYFFFENTTQMYSKLQVWSWFSLHMTVVIIFVIFRWCEIVYLITKIVTTKFLYCKLCYQVNMGHWFQIMLTTTGLEKFGSRDCRNTYPCITCCNHNVIAKISAPSTHNMIIGVWFQFVYLNRRYPNLSHLWSYCLDDKTGGWGF